MPTASTAAPSIEFFHQVLPCGVEFAADVLPDRDTVAVVFRMLTGIADDPQDVAGVGTIAERTLSKGTRKYDGRGLADAFDRLGVHWSSASGRQSTVLRILALPEFVEPAIELVVETLRRPTFPEDAVKVNVDLALQDLKHMEDDPQDLLRVIIQRLTLGPVFGRNATGDKDTLGRITRDQVVKRWEAGYNAGRLQICAAGPVDVKRLAAQLDAAFGGFGGTARVGRDDVVLEKNAQREHRNKDLKQQYIAMTLPGVARGHRDHAVEEVLIGILSGGMSGRLFTEVREKQGLVYWVAAWNENPRGCGIIHLGASTTPERCEKTFQTLLHELERCGKDITEEETRRARNQIIAHMQTEDDMTRARAANLSDDLFHFGRPIGEQPKIDALRAVTREDVLEYARRLPREHLCVATLGPVELKAR